MAGLGLPASSPGVPLCRLVWQAPQSVPPVIAYLATLSSLDAVGRAGASVGAAHSLVPPPARRVPAKHRHLLPLLRQLIGERKGRRTALLAWCDIICTFGFQHNSPLLRAMMLSQSVLLTGYPMPDLLPRAVRAGKCPFGLLLQHHCPLPPQLRQQQQQRRRQEQAAAAAAPGAAAAAADHNALVGGPAAATDLPVAVGRQALAPLPSQGTLLQWVRQQQRPGQEPATAPLAEQLMDELFTLEQGKQAGQRGQPAQQEGQQPPPTDGAPHQQERRQQATAAEQQAHGSVPTADELMDELLLLEQQQQQRKPGAKRQRQDPAAVASIAQEVQPAAAAAEATAAAAGKPLPQVVAAGASLGSLPPTQPAGTGDAAAAGAAAPAGVPGPQPAPTHSIPLASCFAPHKRVVAFVWAVVRCIVPAVLLGDAHNRRVLRDALR